jgi:hypothetical protein
MAVETVRPDISERGAARPACRGAARHWPLALAISASLLLGVPMLLFPLGPDQSIFAYVAHRISLGGFPYVSAWDQKPPAIFLFYLVALHFPGPLMRDVRLFDLCFLCLTLAAIYLLGQRLWGPLAGGLAALLYGTAYTTLYGYWYTAQPDGYTVLPLCLATWLYYRSLAERRAWPSIAAGLLTGVAFQLRYSSVLIGLAWLYIERTRATEIGRWAWRSTLRRLLWLAAGFVLVQAAFLAYLLLGHAFAAYLDAEVNFASHYLRLGGPYSPNGFTWGLFLDAARMDTVYFLTAHLLVSIPAGLALLYAFRPGGDAHAREVVALMLTAYLGVLLQAKFFWYHWLAVLPFLALLGGKALADAASVLRPRGRPAAVLGMAALAVALLFLSPQVTDAAVRQWKGVGDYFGGPARRERFNNQFGAYGAEPYSYLADDEVSRYIRARTTPSDTIYVYGYEPLVYLLSGRESASRFIYVFPVISPWAPESWRDELYADLRSKRPRYIIIQADQGAPWIDGLHEDTAQYAAHDTRLQAILTERYQREAQMEFFTLYRLRD